MNESGFKEIVEAISARDTRYRAAAYGFVREALDYTSKTLKKPDQGPDRHISGEELLEGVRQLVIRSFGPMGLTVLKRWGIESTADFGEIVFNLVEAGVLGKTENDTRDDFTNGYDFHEAFAVPFLPGSERRPNDATGENDTQEDKNEEPAQS